MNNVSLRDQACASVNALCYNTLNECRLARCLKLKDLIDTNPNQADVMDLDYFNYLHSELLPTMPQLATVNTYPVPYGEGCVIHLAHNTVWDGVSLSHFESDEEYNTAYHTRLIEIVESCIASGEYVQYEYVTRWLSTSKQDLIDGEFFASPF